MSRPTAPTVIAVAVVVHGGRVLVGRRAEHAVDAAAKDEFPGGKVEAGETIEAAAARECQEESGILVVIGPRIDLARSTSSRGPIEIHFHRAAPLDAGIPPRSPFAWRPIAALSVGSFPPANAGVIASLLAEHSPA